MLTNHDLFRMSRLNGVKKDNIVAKNQLNTIKIKTNMNLIINLETITPTNNKSGTHWTALVKRKDECVYMDSFGAMPPMEVIKWCKTNKLSYNGYIVQDIQSENCGSFCFTFLHYVQNCNYRLSDCLNDYINLFNDNTKDNDDILIRYLQHYRIKY